MQGQATVVENTPWNPASDSEQTRQCSASLSWRLAGS